MIKKFEDYAKAAAKDPFPFPMPDDEVIMIAQPTLATESAAVAAATASGGYAEGLLAGLRAYAGDEGGEKIAEAYRPLPSSMLAAVVEEMRKHFSPDTED